jgi:hypothetical protein
MLAASCCIHLLHAVVRLPGRSYCAANLSSGRFSHHFYRTCRSNSSAASSTMARSATAAILAVLALALVAATAAQADEAGRSLLAVKPKPTLKHKPTPKHKPTAKVNVKNVPKLKAKPTAKPKKVVVKTFTGKACAKFGQYGVGCSLCTATSCVTCGNTYMKSGTKCGECLGLCPPILVLAAAAAAAVAVAVTAASFSPPAARGHSQRTASIVPCCLLPR